MVEQKIGPHVQMALMGFAILIDGLIFLFGVLTLIPIIGWFLGPIICLFFSFFGGVILVAWFYFLGVRYIGRMGVAFIVKFIPILNMFPTFTLATYLTILTTNNQAIGGIVGLLIPGAAGTNVASAVAAGKAAAGKTGVPPVASNDNAQKGTGTSGRNVLPFKNPSQKESRPQLGSEIKSRTENASPASNQTRPNDGLLTRPEQKRAA
jgi:hypothetical protein